MEEECIYVNMPEYCTGKCSDYLKLHCLLTEWLRKIKPEAKEDLREVLENVMDNPMRVL